LGPKENSKPFRDYTLIYKDFKIEKKIPEFNQFINNIKKFTEIKKDTKLFEVGTGNGWFQILCKKNGINSMGIDVVPHNIEFAENLAKKYNHNLDIILGSIESTDIGKSKYDIITALSVFEHVQYWKKGLLNVYNALKPNGLLLLISTNKFSLISGEYKFPFYGWLPKRIRFKLRSWFQGKEALSYNLDFNQFTYFHLSRFFKKVGFSKIFDIWDVIEEVDFLDSSFLKRYMIKFAKHSKLFSRLSLWFLPITFFICIK
jgi:2-polyprenyl-3-methyl-5-hydroxy-6-metoxy-1,4-benzoquinol methylase